MKTSTSAHEKLQNRLYRANQQQLVTALAITSAVTGMAVGAMLQNGILTGRWQSCFFNNTQVQELIHAQVQTTINQGGKK